MTPNAMLVASTMCAWTYHLPPRMLRPVSTVDTERRLLFEFICCDQHCFAAYTIHRFSTCQDFSTQLPQAHRASSITVVVLAVSLVVGGVVRLVESGLPRWRSGDQAAEI